MSHSRLCPVSCASQIDLLAGEHNEEQRSSASGPGHTVTVEDPRVDPTFPLHSLASFSALQECLLPINYEFKTQQDVGFGKCRRR